MAATMSLLRMPPCISMTEYRRKFQTSHRPFSVSLSSSSLNATKYSVSSQNNADVFPSLPEKEVERPHIEIENEVLQYSGNNGENYENEDLGSPNSGVRTMGIPKLKAGRAYSEGKRKKIPNLTVKEKKELASYALGLGKKLKFQLVGKGGVTDNVVSSFMEILEANELLKVKVLRTCPDELEDVAKQLEEATDSVVVGQIGRTMIVYRPSSMKLKAEEKKKQASRVFVRREWKPRPISLKKGQAPGFSTRGRRASRV